MPKLTIDGKEIEVPKGTKIIEAAKSLGIDIPFYCYHPGLSISGNCRMCLVEVEKTPKLQIACHTEVQEGMVVRTETPKVRETRKHILEFLLVNHPVDCPVCDQAGECWLQDFYMNYGAYESRLDENKVKKHKAVSIGPTVMLDSERCILCSRCVRFLDEVTKTSELGIFNRGDRAEIGLFPGKELNNPYSGNIVDLCPVGALTDKDFRFKARVWYLRGKPSICHGCARGCSIEVQRCEGRPHHGGGDRVMRIKPRFHPDINQWWICDEGRYGYKFHDHGRLLKPAVRRDGTREEISWEAMIREFAGKLRQAGRKVAVFLSPRLSNEELYLAGQLFGKHLNIFHLLLVSPEPPKTEDGLLLRADRNPNTLGAAWLGLKTDDAAVKSCFAACKAGDIQGAVIFGQDLLTLYNHEPVASALDKLEWTFFAGSNRNPTSEFASHLLPSATYFEKEGTVTNFQGKVQRFAKVFEPLGEARPEADMLTALARALDFGLRHENVPDLFLRMVAEVPAFQGLDYEKLGGQATDIRVMAEPVIPSETQASPLIFHEHK
ncbi:MAG: 2Fe-2S iron-sulfur cluster-binding protein [Candidatus Omnitrophota bacterium]